MWLLSMSVRLIINLMSNKIIIFMGNHNELDVEKKSSLIIIDNKDFYLIIEK